VFLSLRQRRENVFEPGSEFSRSAAQSRKVGGKIGREIRGFASQFVLGSVFSEFSVANHPSPYSLAIAGGLQFKHLRIAAAETSQLFVTSVLSNAAVFQHNDPVGHADRREPV